MNAIERIRTKILDITQDELAAAAGVTQPTVSRWERGKLSPSLAELQRVCKAYPSVRPADFFSAKPLSEAKSA